jgi:hypothetical protein
MFRLLSAEESGVQHRNFLKPENVRKYLYNGAGLAVGDYDADGLPDLYLVSQDGPNRLYRNLGDLRFEDVTETAGVDGGEAWGSGATFADIDGDGDLDLFAANMGTRDLFYMNQGDGTFEERGSALGVNKKRATTTGAFADYDRDGDLDLYVLTYRLHAMAEEAPNAKLRMVDGKPTVHPDFVEHYTVIEGRMNEAGQADHLYRNSGDGRFTEVSRSAGISGYNLGLSASWWDWNNDLWPDLYVANDYKGPDRMYLNQGDGNFRDVAAERLPDTPWFSMGSDQGDINNDGWVDLMGVDMSNTTYYMRRTTMGVVEKTTWFTETVEPRQVMRNTLHLNTGTDRFFEIANMAGVESTNWSWAIRIEDLDNDGWNDVFVANGNEKNVNDADLEERTLALNAAGDRQGAIAVLSDMDRMDDPNMVFRNRGDLSFEEVGAAWGLALDSVTHGAVLVDFDRDGDLDAATLNMNDPVAVYRNQSTAGHRLLVRLKGTVSNSWGVGSLVQVQTDQNLHTRQLSLSRGYMSGAEPIVHVGLGEAERIDWIEVRWPSGAVQRHDNPPMDHFLTLTEPSGVFKKDPPRSAPAPHFAPREPGDLGLAASHKENEHDDFALQPLLPYRTSRLGPWLSAGDANGDGKTDVYLGGAAGQPGTLLLATEGGGYTEQPGPWRSDGSLEDMGSVWFDADGDGDSDLYVVSGGAEAPTGDRGYRDRLYLNGGSEGFKLTTEALPELSDSGGPVTAADLDGDGDMDLFIGGRQVPGRYPETPNSRLLLNDGGAFTDVTDRLAPGLRRVGMVTSALWSDADGDGDPDLLVAREYGSIALFRNTGGRLQDASRGAGLAEHSGWWYALAATDLNGDGATDFVAGNLGLNTPYGPGGDRPLTLFGEDLDQDGRPEVVEAVTWDGALYPYQNRRRLTESFPELNDRFETFDAFARASLFELFPSLRRARPLEATRLESVVLLNRGDGSFDLLDLPRLAQTAPVNAIAAGDLDGDGAIDLVLGQNNSTPRPETGRMAGSMSLVLRGDGAGAFEPIWPRASGVIIRGDARSVVLTDIDGDADLDLLVATNDGPLRVFENRWGPKGR